jgi:tRNA nucleotidyltransferase (CCA-adding enzyme)
VSSHVDELAARIAALPGANRLLPALEGLPPAFLVGGALRDLLRGAENVDLDLAIEGDAVATARELATRLEGEALEHERFGTATVRAEGLTVDLATTRRERYPRPGALPEVEAAPLEEDLARRDFTVNAMAAALASDALGRLHDPHAGLSDLSQAVVRVLHYRSFVDDPTRLLRAVRHEVRLAFRMDRETEALAREATLAGALKTISGARVRHELIALLAEPEATAGLERVRDLGLDRALHPALSADPDRVTAASAAAGETGADRVLAALAALIAGDPEALAGWLEGLGLTRTETDRVARAARRGRLLAHGLREQLHPSQLHALLSPELPEALALALAFGGPEEPVLRYLRELAGVRLEITGDDLVAEGVPQSPALGRALAETLRRKLDGEVSGRKQELRAALELAREGGR